MLIVNNTGFKMTSEHRKQQLREAQRRRREKLAASGDRTQVNIFLTHHSKEWVDKWCLENKTDRHELINQLILAYSEMPDQIPLVLKKKVTEHC